MMSERCLFRFLSSSEFVRAAQEVPFGGAWARVLLGALVGGLIAVPFAFGTPDQAKAFEVREPSDATSASGFMSLARNDVIVRLAQGTSVSTKASQFQKTKKVQNQSTASTTAVGERSASRSKTLKSEKKTGQQMVGAEKAQGNSRDEINKKNGSRGAKPEKSKGKARVDENLARARRMAAAGQYADASKLLFQMSRNPQYAKDSAQIKYILGLMLSEMKLNQAAAFVFYDVIRQESKENPKSKYLRQSLKNLAIAADALDSDVLLRYAMKQVDEEEFPSSSRDMLAFRTGELKMDEKNYPEAVRQFARVPANSMFYHRALYKTGLAHAEAGEGEKALSVFENLAERTRDLGVTDRTRVSALLGRARVHYQMQNFESAVDAYRDIPRDTEQWHEALFESTWAMLRDGRFRSSLSNFHSLHSTFYEDHYQPESLLLRGIVYLYICRYDEMAKVLDIFERVYTPVQRDVRVFLKSTNEPLDFYREIQKVNDQSRFVGADRANRRSIKLPFIVASEILKEGDVRRSFNYLRNLEEEAKRLDGMSAGWKSSGIGQYSKRLIEKRIQSTHLFIGKQVRHHLTIIQKELQDLFEQNGFLRFEMISGKRENVRKEIAGKTIPKVQIDEKTERDYYIQNGFEYWPFEGEYWLDEIGNYHYVGVKACE